jgi:hypothetical protein
MHDVVDIDRQRADSGRIRTLWFMHNRPGIGKNELTITLQRQLKKVNGVDCWDVRKISYTSEHVGTYIGMHF